MLRAYFVHFIAEDENQVQNVTDTSLIQTSAVNGSCMYVLVTL